MKYSCSFSACLLVSLVLHFAQGNYVTAKKDESIILRKLLRRVRRHTPEANDAIVFPSGEELEAEPANFISQRSLIRQNPESTITQPIKTCDCDDGYTYNENNFSNGNSASTSHNENKSERRNESKQSSISESQSSSNYGAINSFNNNENGNKMSSHNVKKLPNYNDRESSSFNTSSYSSHTHSQSSSYNSNNSSTYSESGASTYENLKPSFKETASVNLNEHKSPNSESRTTYNGNKPATFNETQFSNMNGNNSKTNDYAEYANNESNLSRNQSYSGTDKQAMNNKYQYLCSNKNQSSCSNNSEITNIIPNNNQSSIIIENQLKDYNNNNQNYIFSQIQNMNERNANGYDGNTSEMHSDNQSSNKNDHQFSSFSEQQVPSSHSSSYNGDQNPTLSSETSSNEGSQRQNQNSNKAVILSPNNSTSKYQSTGHTENQLSVHNTNNENNNIHTEHNIKDSPQSSQHETARKHDQTPAYSGSQYPSTSQNIFHDFSEDQHSNISSSQPSKETGKRPLNYISSTPDYSTFEPETKNVTPHRASSPGSSNSAQIYNNVKVENSDVTQAQGASDSQLSQTYPTSSHSKPQNSHKNNQAPSTYVGFPHVESNNENKFKERPLNHETDRNDYYKNEYEQKYASQIDAVDNCSVPLQIGNENINKTKTDFSNENKYDFDNHGINKKSHINANTENQNPVNPVTQFTHQAVIQNSEQPYFKTYYSQDTNPLFSQYTSHDFRGKGNTNISPQYSASYGQSVNGNMRNIFDSFPSSNYDNSWSSSGSYSHSSSKASSSSGNYNQGAYIPNNFYQGYGNLGQFFPGYFGGFMTNSNSFSQSGSFSQSSSFSSGNSGGSSSSSSSSSSSGSSSNSFSSSGSNNNFGNNGTPSPKETTTEFYLVDGLCRRNGNRC